MGYGHTMACFNTLSYCSLCVYVTYIINYTALEAQMRERKLLEERLASEQREKERLAERLRQESQRDKEDVSLLCDPLN